MISSLLAKRRFAPFFITQFFGAFNDNLFKNALVILLVFNAQYFTINQDLLINICALLFILPFFIFSALAGQLADKYEKTILIKIIKAADIVLALLAILGLYLNNLFLLLLTLFLFGSQATFFSPIKYSILPQHLEDSELLAGNGLVEMGTFIAILIGNILGVLLISIPHQGIFWVSIFLLLISILGLLSSLYIPKTKGLSANLKIDWNFINQTFIIIKESCTDKKLFFGIIAISWFWLYSSIFVTQIPNYTKIYLNANEYVATLLLVAFSIGIGLGSTLCNWLSLKKVELGFVFLGAFGLTIFAIDMALSTASTAPEITLNAFSFIFHAQNWRILLDAFFMGSFAGIYLVPLYTFLQKESNPEACSRVVAANNIINSLFMVFASLIAIMVLNAGFSIPQLFILTGVLNGIMWLYLFKLSKLSNIQSSAIISNTSQMSIKSETGS